MDWNRNGAQIGNQDSEISPNRYFILYEESLTSILSSMKNHHFVRSAVWEQVQFRVWFMWVYLKRKKLNRTVCGTWWRGLIVFCSVWTHLPTIVMILFCIFSVTTSRIFVISMYIFTCTCNAMQHSGVGEVWLLFLFPCPLLPSIVMLLFCIFPVPASSTLPVHSGVEGACLHHKSPENHNSDCLENVKRRRECDINQAGSCQSWVGNNLWPGIVGG